MENMPPQKMQINSWSAVLDGAGSPCLHPHPWTHMWGPPTPAKTSQSETGEEKISSSLDIILHSMTKFARLQAFLQAAV